MTPVIKPAPVRRAITLAVSPEHAFKVFTSDIGRWCTDLGESLLVSADVLASTSDLERDLAWVPLSSYFLRGRSQPVQICRPDWSANSVPWSESVGVLSTPAPSTATR